jgi:hypothetical protein
MKNILFALLLTLGFAGSVAAVSATVAQSAMAGEHDGGEGGH